MVHLAATAALSPDGNVARSSETAQLVGYVDAQLVAQRSRRTAPEQQEYDRVCAVLDAALGGDECKRLMLTGASFSHERALRLGQSL